MVLAGLGGFLLTTLVSNEGPDDALVTLAVSVFAGGTALMLVSLHEIKRRLRGVEKRFDAHMGSVKEMFGRGFAQINESTALVQRLDDSAVETREVMELVSRAAGIKSATAPIVHKFAKSEIARLSELMDDLRTGEAAYQGEDHDWLLTLARSATASIDATSTSIDQAFWDTELGKTYLRAQHAAIQERQVQVRRLFIVPDGQGPDSPVIFRLREQQEDLGIKVRVVSMAELTPSTWLQPKYNFIVFDDAVSYEMTLAVGEQPEPEIETTLITLRTVDVLQRKVRFESLWQQGA
ncbi:hypothetical protein GCM10010329_11960 [Streptomyces spiroverticillatus]|nr:hypothetical protein GCM10010329_11960 [Streptomyces spiroverticillatus]